jgi:hypothetical protein
MGGHSTMIRMAAWYQLGYVKAHSGVVNNLPRFKKLVNQLQLADSLAPIERLDTAAAKKKKDKSFTKCLIMVPMVVAKLAEKGGGMNKLTKKHICALLFIYFLAEMDNVKHKKPKLARKLSECIVNDPMKLPAPTDLAQTND